MGTRFEIIAYCESAERCKVAFDEAFATIAELDATLSNYRLDSELSIFCRGAPHDQPVPISQSMIDVLVVAQEISRKTDGAFDITIGPLTKLWRRARRQQKRPSADRIADAKQSVGYRNLSVDTVRRTAKLHLADMRLDLGGIAKGFAIDRALEAMRKHGVDAALVNGGGDVAVGVAPPERNHWRVQVFDGSRQEHIVLPLKNCAVATSGDLYQFVELDGKRYSHLVDASTGLGLTRFVSSSVIAPHAITADAWASAVALMEAEKSLRMLESLPNCEGLIRTLGRDQEIIEHRTVGFPKGN